MRLSSNVQAMQSNFALHSLGWKAFQQLSVTICTHVFGQTVQSFSDSKDGGRDGAFHGNWTTDNGETLAGSFTVQCKFSQRADQNLSLSSLKSDLTKAQRLAARGLADNYLVFTNMLTSGSVDEEIRRAFEAVPGVNRCLIFGGERITEIIREKPRLRMLVPRIYGLGDLSQIVDERAYDQAEDILSSMGGDMAKFVITGAHRAAAEAIIRYGFVLLLGEPACGKSAIAAALALGAWDEWECFTVKARSPDEIIRHLNVREKQFFWVDDAFGPTQLDWSLASQWNLAFPHINAAIKRGAKFVFTSRDYIYRSARNILKNSSLPIINDSQVIIHVEALTKDEKEQILYNHIRLGTQAREYKSSLKPHLRHIAEHRRFSPEIARRLGNPAFTRDLSISRLSLDDFVERPIQLLQENIRTMDPGSRAALALVYMNGNALNSPVDLHDHEEEAVCRLGSSLSEFRRALPALEGSFLLHVHEGGISKWTAKHPTILDALANLITEDPELLDVYLAGTSSDKLLSEVCCGKPKYGQLSKVDIPSSRYPAIATRVAEMFQGKWEHRNIAANFIAYRCDRLFISTYLNIAPDFIRSLHIGAYLDADSHVRIVNRLNEIGLLPEEERERLALEVCDVAVETPDAGFLDQNNVNFLTEADIANILLQIRLKLLPNLNREIDNWRMNFSDTDAEAFLSPFTPR